MSRVCYSCKKDLPYTSAYWYMRKVYTTGQYPCKACEKKERAQRQQMGRPPKNGPRERYDFAALAEALRQVLPR